ncbi:MAG: GyrI-like domain-containing protein [Gaiellaceae bacterium]
MSTLALEFTVTHVPEQTFAYVVRTVAPGEAGEFIRGAISRVHDFAAAHGGTVGPPMTLSTAPDEHGALTLEVGWPVPDGTQPEAPVEIKRLAPSVAIVHLHVGPYEDLPALYGELFAQAHEHGYTPVAMPRERYLTAPGDGPPVTEIVWPVA